MNEKLKSEILNASGCSGEAIVGGCLTFLALSSLLILLTWVGFISFPTSSMLYHNNESFLRDKCQRQMREIAFALDLYHREHGEFPPAFTTDEYGTLLHSWRVQILPYLQDKAYLDIYKKIRLDEPWNSKWNQQFHVISGLTPVFNCPTSMESTGGTTTYYMVIDDAGRVVPESGILFAEREIKRDKQYNWMNPNYEIRFEDIKEGVNSNPNGITSDHDYMRLGNPGANICTFNFEIKWIPNNP